MDLRKLHSFLQIANDGSITIAAKHLNLSQPALSLQLKELESELGVPLFFREKKRLHLTSAGYALISKATDLLELDEKISKEIRAFGDNPPNELWIGGVESQLMSYLAKEITSFSKDNPDFIIHIKSSSDQTLNNMLMNNQIDIAIVSGIDNDTSDYDYLPFPQKEFWGILTLKNDPLANMIEIRPQDLQTQNLICDQIVFRNIVQPWLGEYADLVSIHCSVNLTLPGNYLVENGFGSLITAKINHHKYSYYTYTFIPFSPLLETSLFLKWKKKYQKTPTVRKFIQHLKENWEAVPQQ